MCSGYVPQWAFGRKRPAAAQPEPFAADGQRLTHQTVDGQGHLLPRGHISSMLTRVYRCPAAARPSQDCNGDQAGSEASVGVVTTRSLKPVISIDTSRELNPLPRESRAAVSRQNMITRPFGAKVGPST